MLILKQMRSQNVQVCTCANVPVHKFAGMPVCNC